MSGARPQVLFIRYGAIGDILVTTAALHEVHSRHTEDELTLLGEKYWLQVLDPTRWPRLNCLLIGAKKARRLEIYRPKGSQWERAGETSLEEAFQNQDVIYNMQYKTLRYAWLAWRAQPRQHFGSSPMWAQWLFTHWAPWVGEEPPIHDRDRNLRMVFAPPRSGLQFVSMKSALARLESDVAALPTQVNWKEAILPSLLEVHPENAERWARAKFKSYILLNPTCSRREKAWPADRFNELATRLTRDYPEKMIRIIGGPNETEWLQEAARGLPSDVIVQTPSLRDVFDVVAGAHFLVTNTSSMQNVAAIQKTPCVTLMGASPLERWRPLGQKDLPIKAQGDYSHIRDAFAHEVAAYRDLSVDMVHSRITQWAPSI